MDLVSAELPARTLVVAIDPGKATNRVLLADGERGLIGEPVSLPTLREGIERLFELIDSQAAPETVIAIEATGSLHLPWSPSSSAACRARPASSPLQRPRRRAPSWARAASRTTTATAPRSSPWPVRAAAARSRAEPSRRCWTRCATAAG